MLELARTPASVNFLCPQAIVVHDNVVHDKD